ncbi:MAG TPA: transposase [candidate division Zixibacteria bacterium]|nr:transposase [candidate division Zixibacteria bacterium]
MIRTYSLKHSLDVGKFLYAYIAVLNSMIHDIWTTIEWEEKPIEGKKQKRLIPYYRKDKVTKSILRNRHLENWEYANHWIDSALKTAFAILDSWKKNYNRGRRKRNCPVVKRPFVRVKQTLMKLEGDKLRITIKPYEYLYIDLSKRYFKLGSRIGEPVLTLTHIHLPIEVGNNRDKNNGAKIGWDSNKTSLDGYAPKTGWICIGLKDLHTAHISYDNKRRRINKLASRKKRVGKRLKAKYSVREKNRISLILHKVTNKIASLGCMHGFEDLDKSGMLRWNRKWNRELSHTDWKKIVKLTSYKSSVELVDPYHTSKECSRCGCVNQDLNGVVFRCVNPDCGLRINRQHNAAINIYLRMEGLPHDIGWFDENIVSGFTQTEAELKETNELVRSLYDMVKPQFYEESSN